MTVVVTAATAATTAAAITSAPHELEAPARLGRPDGGTARARTGELYARHVRTVAGLCRGLLRDRSEAEDAVQQVFLSAHRALLNGTAPREPAAWLAAIARNECLSRIRSRMREPLPVAAVADGASALPDPLAVALRRADLEALWHAIEQLPRRQRDALLLREFGGLSYDELSEALGVSRPTVESLLFRARHALRNRLEAVYAALSGASWLDAIGRLVAGGSGAAAPVAVKAVALGVGAAALTGGAVGGPRMLHRPATERRAAAVATRHIAPAALSRVEHHARSAPPVQAPTATQVRAPAPAAGRHGGGDVHRRGDDGAPVTTAAQAPADGTGGRPEAVGQAVSSAASASSTPDGGSGSGDTHQSGDRSRGSGDGGGTSGKDDGVVASTTQPASTFSADSTSGETGSGESGSGGSSQSGDTGGADGGGTVSGDSGSGGSDGGDSGGSDSGGQGSGGGTSGP